MMWYWYVSQSNEIFVDMDKFSIHIDHMRRRLQGAIECGYLFVKEVKIYDSTTPEHKHIIISLIHHLPQTERAVWALIFRSDIYRAACTLMRIQNGVKAPDILIAQKIYHRAPEAICQCDNKHNNAKTMEACPAAKALRGEKRTTMFFGKKSNNPCNFL